MYTSEEIVEKWLLSFASDVPEQIIKNYVTKSCNYLWHIFGYKKAPYFEGVEARKALDSLSSEEQCMIFHSGYSVNDKNQIDDLSLCGKLSSFQMDELQEKQEFSITDIYLVERNFQWAYVVTHHSNCGDSSCGPYFCYCTK